MRTLMRVLLSALIFLSGSGCRPSNDAQKVAEVDGIIVTRSELDRSAGKALYAAREQLYRMERETLDVHIGMILLAREATNRGVSLSALLAQEVTAKVPPVSEAEIQSFYETSKGRLGVDLARVRGQISEYLTEQKMATVREDFIQTLRSKAKITSYLKPLPAHRSEVSLEGAPFKGAAEPRVTIVKFEDFDCPFCKTVQPTLAALLKKYEGRLRLVHKDFPLEAIHPRAPLAAEAARCAGDQGKYWHYHDELYGNAPKLSAADLRVYAKEVGLNMMRFDQCLTGGKFKNAVQKDLSEGAQLGITGTPAFFINGRDLSGAQPLDVFSAIIDEELAAAK